jgi:hypothetical protein
LHKYAVPNLAAQFLIVEQEGRLSPNVAEIEAIFFFGRVPFKKQYFITTHRSFAVKFLLLCTVLISDLQ